MMSELNEKAKIRTAQLVSVAFCLMICLFLLLFCHPFYVGSDETVLSDLAAGNYGEEYRTNLVLNNVLYGHFIRLFYHISENVNWYSLVPILISIFAFINVSLLISYELPNAWGILFSSLFVLIFGRYVIVNFMFTIFAAFFSATGLIFMYSAIFKQDKIYRYLSVIGILLAILGCIIRRNAFLSCAAIIGVFCIVKVCRDKFWKMKFGYVLKNACPFIILFALMLTVRVIHRSVCTGNPAMNFWVEYNHLRSSYLDFPLPEYGMYAEQFMKLGIDELDYKLLTDWNYGDPNKFSLEVFKGLNLIHEQYTATLHQDGFTVLKLFVRRMLHNMTGHIRFLLIALMAAYAAFRRKSNLWLLLPFSVAAMEFFYLSYVNRFVERAYIGVWLAVYLITAIVLCRDFSASEKKFRKFYSKMAAVLAASLIVSLPGAVQLRGWAVNNAELEKEYLAQSSWKTELAEDSDCLFVQKADMGETETMELALTPRRKYKINTYELGGWNNPAPFQEQLLKDYGVADTGAMLGMLDDSKNVYYIEASDDDYSEVILSYLRKEYGRDAQLEHLNTLGNMDILRFYIDSAISDSSAEKIESEYGLKNAVRDDGIILSLSADKEKNSSSSIVLSGYCGSEKIDPYIQRSWIKVTSGDNVQYFRGTKQPQPELADVSENLHAPAAGVIFELDPSLFESGREFSAEIILEGRGVILSKALDNELFQNS